MIRGDVNSKKVNLTNYNDFSWRRLRRDASCSFRIVYDQHLSSEPACKTLAVCGDYICGWSNIQLK